MIVLNIYGKIKPICISNMIHVLFTNRNLINVIKKKKNKEEN